MVLKDFRVDAKAWRGVFVDAMDYSCMGRHIPFWHPQVTTQLWGYPVESPAALPKGWSVAVELGRVAETAGKNGPSPSMKKLLDVLRRSVVSDILACESGQHPP
ncbi:hypothetical protein [Paracidovorax wautersii]|uniref:hypothetical protein n=1 Tax=Paracidovorax wautersii TaxID=1177982 RepID=UPI00286C67BA|nr:hypothetical protein [Paracidovorax wautersii]